MSANVNTSANGTQPPGCASPGTLAAKTFAYSLILVVSLAGNTLIGIIVYKTKTMRKTVNYFIVNVAMSDLFFPIFVFPSTFTDLYGGFLGNQLGQTFCNVMMLLQYVSSIVSIQSLVLIGVDRFRAVVFPLRPPLITSKLCPFFILSTWVVAIALSVPTWASNTYKPVKFTAKAKCYWLWSESFFKDTYSYTMLFVVGAISFFLIILFYSFVVFKLKTRKVPGESSHNAEEQRVRRHRNVFKMVIAIVSGYALCWGPLNAFTILNALLWNNTTRYACGVMYYWYIALFMAHTNCAINPMICFIFSGNYRQGLKGLFGFQGTMQR